MELTNEFIRDNTDKRFNLYYKNNLTLNNVKLFVATNGVQAYLKGKQKNYGRALPTHIELDKIEESTRTKKERTNIQCAQTLLKKIHPNVWDELKIQLKEGIKTNVFDTNFTWHFTDKLLRFKNISSLLSSYEQERLKDAFENKTQYSWIKYASSNAGRDLRISCEPKEDGVFRCYFSSEYAGCGNGDYWLLINPTTAVFYEKD